jgi:hypothetical protein
MSLDILEYPRLAQQNGSTVGIVSGAPRAKGTLTAGQTFTPVETDRNSQNVVLELYANGAAHVYHLGNAALTDTLASGTRKLIQVPAATVLTLVS